MSSPPQSEEDKGRTPATPAGTLPELPITFRPGTTRAVLLGVGIVMFVVITAGAVLMVPSGGGQLSFIVAAALFLSVLVVLSRPKVVADRSGVTVINLTQSRRLAWAEILRVNLRPGDAWVFLDLSDGSSLPVLGIQPGIAKQRAIADARALRALVESYGTGTESDGTDNADR